MNMSEIKKKASNERTTAREQENQREFLKCKKKLCKKRNFLRVSERFFCGTGTFSFNIISKVNFGATD